MIRDKTTMAINVAIQTGLSNYRDVIGFSSNVIDYMELQIEYWPFETE